MKLWVWFGKKEELNHSFRDLWFFFCLRTTWFIYFTNDARWCISIPRGIFQEDGGIKLMSVTVKPEYMPLACLKWCSLHVLLRPYVFSLFIHENVKSVLSSVSHINFFELSFQWDHKSDIFAAVFLVCDKFLWKYYLRRMCSLKYGTYSTFIAWIGVSVVLFAVYNRYTLFF